MKTPLDYFALTVALLPVSGVIAFLICQTSPRLNRWMDRLFTRRRGNRYRGPGESWHQKHPGAPKSRLRERLRR